MSLRRTFDGIYRRNEWNGTDTRSGPGSTLVATEAIVPWLLEVVDQLGISSVIDAACGEGLWQPDLPGYIGIDVSAEAIRTARRLHPERTYLEGDVLQGCARADLVICRDALQHLSLTDGVRALDAIRASGSTWLVASTYIDAPNAYDPPSGGYHSPDLEAPPYSLPPARQLVHDGYDYGGSGELRDRRKMLGLWRLPG